MGVSIPVVEQCAGIAAGTESSPAARLNRLCLWPQREPAFAPEAGAAFPQVAAAPVFVSEADFGAMTDAVRALELIARSESWRQFVVEKAPVVARRNPGNAGVLYGVDFHLTPDGPRVIEINTNAGGALINTQLLSVQAHCCSAPHVEEPAKRAHSAESAILASFLAEWQAVRATARPRTIAIVDERPEQQYLYPEFRAFAALFEAADIETVICDPRELEGGMDGLHYRGKPIDLIYNRLTDFYLETPEHAALRAAYVADAVVLTPHPYGHALFADKRNLAVLSDAAALERLGFAASVTRPLLAVMAPTRIVRAEDAETLWRDRRGLFFKPASAFGGRGAYEGAKLTRSVFQRIIHEDYVAQALVSPPIRQAWVGGEPAELKYDVRCYAYRGEVQLVAARLYRGQATNFRTAGGGFASVHIVPS